MNDIKLPPLPEWSKMDNLGGLVPSEIRTELTAYAREAVRLNMPDDARLQIDEREAFEAIFLPGSGATFDRDANGFYKSFFVFEAWKVWQARAALSAPHPEHGEREAVEVERLKKGEATD